jgi:FAD/FMN-containing dehydrogenase
VVSPALPSGNASTESVSLTRIDSSALKALKQDIKGSVVLPDAAHYDELRRPWLEVLEQHPAMIVEADCAEDVVASVNFARDHGLSLGVMATGHGIAAPCNGLLLRFTKMNGIVVDTARNVATIGPGVVSSELLKATERHGLVYPAGQAGNVGVVGYALGGGIGWLVRKLGAAVDYLVGADTVLADGSIVRADDAAHPDLFWALRGGGGNFGVVVSLDIALTPLKNVFGGELYYPLERAAELLRFYRTWSSQLSNETSTIFRVVAVPPAPTSPKELRGKTVCMIGLAHADPATADTVLAPLDQLGAPLYHDMKKRSIASMAALDPASHMKNAPAYGQVEYLNALSDDVLDGLAGLAHTKIPPLTQFEIQQLGGALLNKSFESRGAFEPSSASYLLHLESPAVKASLTEIAGATTEAFAALGDVYTGEKYYNFLRGDEQPDVERAFGNTKFARLQQIKAQYDPNNLFHLNLNIAPANA